MKTNSLPPPDYLNHRYHYNPDTGVLTHRNPKKKSYQGREVGSRPNADGYKVIKIDGVLYIQSRIIWMMMTEQDPGELEVDHKDEDKLNNKWSNLRLVTSSQNKHNRSLAADNTSGFKGVCWDKAVNKWKAAINFMQDGKVKHINLGRFETAEEAHEQWSNVASVLHGSCFNPG